MIKKLKMNTVNPNTPCIKICKINPETGLCEGCYRNLDEISDWTQLDFGGKQRVYNAIENRKIKSGHTE
jgi:predicted Fe-S protein YdhL (DUF1289 family)